MKTLIVDNTSKLINELFNLAPMPVEIVEWNNLKNIDLNNVNLIILSGASNLFAIVEHEENLDNEIDLIINSNKPIIGICYGCELVARAFGAKLEKMDTEKRGSVQIKALKKDNLFGDLESFTAYEAHHWVIKNIPEDLEVLGTSDHGVEIFKHRTRPIYGLQFHPEKTESGSGKIIFENILKEIKKRP